jgi:hypothetical protein
VSDDLDDYVDKWFFRADEDAAVVNALIQSDPQAYASTICFRARQAVEKYLKALLACRGWRLGAVLQTPWKTLAKLVISDADRFTR